MLSDTSKLSPGEVYNMDIAYGPTVGIGGIKYALILIDRKTKRKLIYGLKNLKNSIRNALEQYLVDAGTKPRLIKTDFDHRLIGGKTRKYLLNRGVKVEAAPPRRQHQNGLIERHWQNIVTMARNWMGHQLLPSIFWFFAVKRAVEVSNMLPVETKQGEIYTPYERTYKRKVDFCNLFPMFSKAYVKIHREKGGKHNNKFNSQTVQMICVGKCPKSDSFIFYHPETKVLVSDADGHRFDNYSPSGPQFNLKYDRGFTITRKLDQEMHQKPMHENNDTTYIKIAKKYIPATVLQVPLDEENEPYIVQMKETGEIREVMSDKMNDHDPTRAPTDNPSVPNHLYSWARHQAKVTLFLSSHWTTPKQGYLNKSEDEWYFKPG